MILSGSVKESSETGLLFSGWLILVLEVFSDWVWRQSLQRADILVSLGLRLLLSQRVALWLGLRTQDDNREHLDVLRLFFNLYIFNQEVWLLFLFKVI